MSRIVFDWPDEGAERVRAARERLRVAGDALRAMSLDERLTAVAGVVGDWTAPDSAWRRELATSLADSTPGSLGTIAEGLESALRAWQPEQLVRCVREELGSALRGGRRRVAPYDWTTVIAGGAIPMPTLLSSLLPLIVGSPVLLRETSSDPVTAGLVARSLAARDERLARSFEPIAFPTTDRAAYDIALEAPCVVATGSDETIAEIAGRLRVHQRFVPYGHRFSIVAIGPGIAESSASLREAARGIALDVARWDQGGCLSPVCVYLVELDRAVAERFAGEISAALERLEAAMPRGEVDTATRASIATERAEARMRAASGRSMLFEGRDHTVVLETDAQPRPAPLHRFLRLHPVHSRIALLEALTPFSGQLSTIAIAGLIGGSAARSSPTDATDGTFFEQCARLNVSRFTFPGRMQTPRIDWPRDGMSLIASITRFADFDRPDSDT